MNLGRFEQQKIHYRPIEAAIRWAGLFQQEKMILHGCESPRPKFSDISGWPTVYIMNERLFDGIIHNELPAGKRGVRGEVSITDHELTIRHVELKRWMMEFYPDEKPDFLFSDTEKKIQHGVDIETVHVLLASCESLKMQLNIQSHTIAELNSKQQGRDLKPRSENTYLSIIGALLSLIMTEPSSELNSSRFKTVESLISEMLTLYPNHPGLSERTIRNKFAAAKRVLPPN